MAEVWRQADSSGRSCRHEFNEETSVAASRWTSSGTRTHARPAPTSAELFCVLLRETGLNKTLIPLRASLLSEPKASAPSFVCCATPVHNRNTLNIRSSLHGGFLNAVAATKFRRRAKVVVCSTRVVSTTLKERATLNFVGELPLGQSRENGGRDGAPEICTKSAYQTSDWGQICPTLGRYG